MPLRSHPYASLDDLRAMQSIVTAAWRSDSRPLVPCTVGDLAWWVAQAGPDADLSERVRIWTDGDEPVGWGWLSPPALLDWFVGVDLEAGAAQSVRAAIIDWLEESAGPTARPTAWAADGWAEARALSERGFAPEGSVLSQFYMPLDRSLPEPELPAGYSIRSLAGPDEIPARVAVHRAAFAPSKLTAAKYEVLVTLHPYAYERDLVVTAPDGTFAAFTMCWLDADAAIGEFEPVGVHPDHQRRGLGRAINTAGLRRLQELGAKDAMVFSEQSNAASEALYRSVGFHQVAVHRVYGKPSSAGR